MNHGADDASAERTAQDRAHWALRRACNGWRSNRQCIDAHTGAVRESPHPGCLRAQEEHDYLLNC